jgi:hypothetical protein
MRKRKMFNMDEVNEWESIYNNMNDFSERRNSLLLSKIKNVESVMDEIIEVTYKKTTESWSNKRCYYYFQINKALDYFNARKDEGYEVSMRKVET